MGNEITFLSDREIEKMRRAGRLAAKLLDHLGKMVKPVERERDGNSK